MWLISLDFSGIKRVEKWGRVSYVLIIAEVQLIFHPLSENAPLLVKVALTNLRYVVLVAEIRSMKLATLE